MRKAYIQRRILLMLTLACSGLLGACREDQGASKPPSLETMSSVLVEKQDSFNVLRDMLESDFRTSKLKSVNRDYITTESDTSWPRPREAWGISEARWSEYKKLFLVIGLQEGIRKKNSPDRIEFVVWAEGITDAEITRGIVYSKQHLESIRTSGDDLRYQHIHDGWYAFGLNGWD